MIDQLTLQTLGILLTGLTVSIAAIYYTLTLRYTRRNQDLQLETRQAQLFMQIYNVFTSKEFHRNWWDIINWEFKDFEEYMEKYGSRTNPDAAAQLSSVGSYFEGMGVMVNRNLIDTSLVDDLVSGLLIRYWERFKPIMYSWRERMNYPQFGEWVEYLYNEIRPIAEEQHPELKT